jgi:hypothetical protein
MPAFIKMGLGGTGFLGQPTKDLVARKKRAQNRIVLPGYPVTRPFGSIEDVKEYLSGDRIICLLCGKSYRALGCHLPKIHDIDADKYREMYGIPWTYGLACSETRETLSRNTIENIKKGKVPAFQPGNVYNENPTGGREQTQEYWKGRKQSPEHKAKRMAAQEEYLIRTGKKRPEHVHIDSLPCLLCGTDVDQPAAGQKLYCSTRCRSRYYAKKAEVEAVCSLCGESFIASGHQGRRIARGLSVYCSLQCRQSANGRQPRRA